MLSGENVLWAGKPVKVPFIVPSLMAVPFGIIFMSVPLSMLMMIPRNTPFIFQLFPFFFILIGFFTAFGGPIMRLMQYSNTEYMITDKRIITQTGVVGLDTRFVDLDRVQEVYVKVGFFDRMFETGSVNATTAGGSYVYPSLASLREPYEVQKLLQEAVEKARTKTRM